MARPQSPLVGYNTNVRHRGKLYHIQTEDSGINHPHVITHLFADGGRIIASRKTSYAEHVGAEDLPGIVRKMMQDQHKSIFIELRDCVFDEDTPPAPPTNEAPATEERSAQPPAKEAPKAAEGRAKRSADKGAGKPTATGPRDTQPDPSAKGSEKSGKTEARAENRAQTVRQDVQGVDIAAEANEAEQDIRTFERAAAQRVAESAAARAQARERAGFVGGNLPQTETGDRHAQSQVTARGSGRYRQTVPARNTEAPKTPARATESIFGGQLLKGRSLDEVILSYLADDLGESDH